MNIALIGYGKMGKAIEAVALQRGHKIVLTIDADNLHDFTKENVQKAAVAIEFTGPHTAVANLQQCLEFGIPVVCGSTGWLQEWNTIKLHCDKVNGTLLYASNFSVGVNLFFELNQYLARLMNRHKQYNVSIEEIHHTEKKDAPSGTAITLAEQVMQQNPELKDWVNELSARPDSIGIVSKRIDPAPGTHIIKYSSPIDDIEIIHTAHSREGFANGAVLAAEFLQDKKGIFTMKEVLGL